MKTRLFVSAMALCGALAFAAPSSASTVTYTTLGDWLAATGGATWTVDFEGFATDTQFRTTTVDAGPFSLQQEGADEGFRNYVDVPPLDSGFAADEGPTTASASMYTNSDGPTTVVMSFGNPVSAWGGVFFMGSLVERLDIALYSPANVLLDTLNVPDGDGLPGGAFFGFTSSAPVGSLRFQSRTLLLGRGGEGFTLDDVRGVSARNTTPLAPVPEPASLTLLGLGLAGMGARRWRQRKA